MLSRCKIFSTERLARNIDKYRLLSQMLTQVAVDNPAAPVKSPCLTASLRCGVFVCLRGRIVRVWTLVGRPTESVCRPTRQSALCSGSCQKAGQSSASPSFDLT